MTFRSVAVYGAGGLVGRQALARLPGARAIPRGSPLALDGIDVVVNCAGPMSTSAAATLDAAMAAGAHYIDVGGEQPTLHDLHERHESTARRAGRVALPAMGVDCALGDFAAAWAASALSGEALTGELVRGAAPDARIAEARPLDAIAVSYVYDDLVVSAGSQRALFRAAFAHPLVWRRDRWEPATARGRRVNAGAAAGGERDAIAFGGGDAITVPRHVATASVATFVSTSRSAAVSTAMKLLSRALPLLPRAASERLVPYAPSDADHARTRFAIVAEARRGFSDARVIVRGADPYRTTAAIVAWAARALATRATGPIGIRAPSEIFRADLALRALAAECEVTIDPPM